MFFENTVPLVTEKIETEDVMNVLYAFRETNARSLLLSSNGGSAYSFIELSRYLIERNVSMIGCGPVVSLAAMFFFCGKIRVATSETIFLIHEGFLMDGTDEKVTKGEAQMRALICECENNIGGYRRWISIYHALVYLDKIGAEIISQRTSLSAGMAMELMRAEHKFNVDDALRYGIIQDVIEEEQIHILSQFGTYSPW